MKITRKMIMLLLSFVLILVPCVTFGNTTAVEENIKSNSFKYNMDSDKSSVCNANVSIEYVRNEDAVLIRELEIKQLGVLKKNIEMNELDKDVFEGMLSDNESLILDFSKSHIIINYIKDENVYSFSEDAKQTMSDVNEVLKTENVFTKKNSETLPEKELDNLSLKEFVASLNAKGSGYPAGSVKEKKNNQVYMRAIWNPSDSKKLAIRVNTQGKKTATTVRGIKISSAKVPSKYIVKSLNPTGSNDLPNFVHYLKYILEETVKISMPSYTTEKSSCSGRYFTFNLQSLKKVKWNDMNKTKGSAKGFCFHVFLDKNLKSQKPAPTGKITIYYYISGTGAFNAKLDF